MGFYLIGPLVTLIPLRSISSWAYKSYCDDGLDRGGYDFGLVVLALLLAQLKTGAAAPRLADPPKSRAIALIARLDVWRCNSKANFGRSW